MCHRSRNTRKSGPKAATACLMGLGLWIVQTPQAQAQQAVDLSLALQGVTFRVECDNASSINTLRVSPAGLEIDNSPIHAEVDGLVAGAEVADLNVDGSPELYVYVNSAGSGGYGSIAAWSANDGKSLSEIHLPELAEDPEYGTGYMGHDSFVVAEQYLVRSFPLYLDGDTNADPSGGERQVLYRLEPGEATWQLVIDRATDFE